MQQLKDVFDTQKQIGSNQDKSEELELSTEMIRFDSSGASYLVVLDKIREITERNRIVPYPEKHTGHLGLISLRGEIVPVLSLRQNHDSRTDDRCVVFEFEPGMPFCLLASNVKKVAVARDKAGCQKVFQIDGRAATILETDDLAGLIKDTV